MKNVFFYQTEIGRIGIAENGTAITDLYFDGRKPPDDSRVQETALLKKAGEQLTDYLAGKRNNFDLPFAYGGTEFQQSVWRALQTIPYGETWSYKQLADAVGNAKASRAVGMANNKNPLPIFIPCHRVIGANGGLVGYAGGLDVKEHLLKLEQSDAVR